MRKSSLARGLFAALSIVTAGAAEAQLFGIPFGRPASRYAPRQRRPAPPGPAREIPTPPPRPHFASDDATVAPAQKAPLAEKPAPADANTGASTPEAPKAAVPADSTPPLPPEKPAALAPSVAPAAPAPIAPSGATTAFTPRQPEVDAGCLDRLKAAKVAFEPATLGPQPDARCTVVEPIKLSGLTLDDGGSVAFPDRPTIACTTAATFAAYVHDLLSPLSRGSFGAALTAVWTGPGLECRSRDHIPGAKLSAHGQGLAVDIAQLRLADGRTIEVGTPKDAAAAAFETAARAGACGYFHTVLGPGSDSYHRNHWHFDLLVRGRTGDSKYCK